MAEEWTTKKIDKYVIVNKLLGQGASSFVYRGFLQEDETKQVAVKTIKIADLSHKPRKLELIKREIAIRQKLHHPNIVRLYDVARTNNYLYMFLEYCADGNLKDYMEKKEAKRLSELEAVIFIKHIVEGFKILYKSKIIHRHIKPANILLHQGVAKITNFEFAEILQTDMNECGYLDRLGAPSYMAPQILECQPFSSKCDIWSLGVTFYELLYGTTPWLAENAYQLLENIKKQPLKFPPKPVRSQKVKELISKMLKIDEQDRISWDSVFEDPEILISEETIREIQKSISLEKQRQNLEKSICLNQQYLDTNQVVFKIKNLSQKMQNYKPLQNNQEQMYAEDFLKQIDSKITECINANKKAYESEDYYSYFLLQRNIAFFSNFIK